MKLVKSLLLGSAAGLCAVTGATAADLPAARAAPVDYVRVCPVHGVGFFYIPGTESCLRITGRVRAEYNYTQSRAAAADLSGWRTLARVGLDARTATAYGTLRAFILLEAARRTGSLRSGTQERIGQAEIATGIDHIGRSQTNIYVLRALVQFMGFSAGRTTSFYDFYANDTTWSLFSMGSDLPYATVFAYTATFGGGWSATIAVEDSIERRQPLLFAGTFDPVAGVFQPSLLTSGFGPAQVNKLPDVVANVRVDQAWGSAQLSAALHELDAAGVGLLPVFPGGPVPGATIDAEYGWAIQGGLKLNLPMIAAGDVLWLQAAYAQGATAYSFGGTNLPNFGISNRFLTSFVDGVVLPDGDIRKTTSWSVVASLTHYWVPTLRSNFFAGYGRFEVPSGFDQFIPLAGSPGTLFPTGVLRDTEFFEAGTNLIWSPVSGLDIGVEAMYRKIDPKGRVLDLNRTLLSASAAACAPATTPCAVPPVFTVGSDDIWQFRARVQRDF
jgi:hypothetical protein